MSARRRDVSVILTDSTTGKNRDSWFWRMNNWSSLFSQC